VQVFHAPVAAEVTKEGREHLLFKIIVMLLDLLERNGVIVASDKPKLPFFSLVSFRQAARELHALGYNWAFAWIEKPKSGAKAKAKRSAKGAEDVAEVIE
jgi:hypothetical protein